MASGDGPPIDWSLGDIDYPRALLVALGLALGVALLVAAGTSAAAFGAYNPAWDGASSLRGHADAAGADSHVRLSTTTYGETRAEGTVALVLSPDEAYGPEAAARVRRFVERGGTLVVAEDFGPHGNALLAAVGARARVDGALLRDEREYDRAPALPRATTVAEHGLVAGVEALTLNYGTSVEPNGATVLVRTSPVAYHDRNRNATLDESESLGRYPVATVERVGAGHVVTVGDPSVFINAMLERPGNERFVRNLFAGHDRVLLDYSHAARPPPLAWALLVVRGSVPLQVLLGGLAVGLVALAGAGTVPGRGWLRRRREPEIGGELRADPAAVAALLRERHPDWTAERARRVTEAVMGPDPIPEDDDE